MSVICGRTSSLNQRWWHSGAKNLAGGNALRSINPSNLEEQGKVDTPRNELSDGSKSVFKDEAYDISGMSVTSYQLYAYRSSETLSIDNYLGPFSFFPITDIVQASLCIYRDAIFIWNPSR